MREINKIAEGLFEKIRDRFEDVSLGDENAHATQNPEEARFFNFDYVVDGKNYGNVTLSIIDETSLKVYFSKNISHDLDDEERHKWYGFLKELREFAKRNLLSFEPRDITRGTLKHRDIQQVSKADSTYNKDEVIGESRLYGTSRSSYENDGPVRIIIRHSDHINPEQRGSRSRKIRAMYLETAEGERFKLPHNNLRYARAMARHVQEGGMINDEFGQHITEIADECSKLRPFKAAMIRRVFEDEETQRMVEAAFEYHSLLKDTLGRMSGRKGYQQCKEQFVATSTSYIPEEDFDADSLRERFVKRTFNERMSDALPIVHKAYKMKKTNKMAEAFESWAHNVAEAWDEDEEGNVAQWGQEPINIDDLADILAEPLPLGVDGVNATTAIENVIDNDDLAHVLLHASKADPEADARDIIMSWISENVPAVFQELQNELSEGDEYGSYGAVYDEDGEIDDGGYTAVAGAIMRRIARKHLEELGKYGPIKIMNAAKEVAEWVCPVDEVGSSDTSIWTKQALDLLAREEDQEMAAEDFGYRSPADSMSPLSLAQQSTPYCDACDSTECHCNEVDEDAPLRKTASPSKKRRDAKYYDYLARTLGEGKMKDIALDIEELSNKQFVAKYGKSKDEVKATLAESHYDTPDYVDMAFNELPVGTQFVLDPNDMHDDSRHWTKVSDTQAKNVMGRVKDFDEYEQSETVWTDEELDEGLSGLQKFGAGAALVGALAGNAYMDQKSVEASPQMQKLEQLYQQALANDDTAKANELEDRIDDLRTRIELGKGEVLDKQGNPVEPKYESTDDEKKLERYHELIKQGMDPDDAEVEVFNDEGDDKLDEMKRLAGL